MKFRYLFFNLLFLHFCLLSNSNIEVITQPECCNILMNTIKILDLKLKNKIKIIHYRDPRDCLIINSFYLFLSQPNRTNLILQKIIKDLLPKSCLKYNAFKNYKIDANTYIIKFEDIFSDYQINIENIKKMFNHFNIDLTPTDLKKIYDNIFLDNNIIAESEIGSWRKFLSNSDKFSFKKICGQLLIDLGYEKDFNW